MIRILDADGKIERAESSSQQDENKIDVREGYQNGELVRANADTNGDGWVDRWATHGPGGALATVAIDEDDDGSPDRHSTYGADGRLLTTETEPDGRGGYRKKVAGE